MSATYPAGLPTPALGTRDPRIDDYWSAAEAGELVLPHCPVCAAPFWYPRGFCPRCGSESIEWRKSTGRGRVHSYTIVRRAGGDWAEHTPFVLAYVELDDGVTLVANVIDCPEDAIEIGLPVTARFERGAGEGQAPALRFVPRG
jgi:uncharacterized protein